MADDIDFLTLAKSGDMDAFERLVLQYEKLIYNISYRMLSDSEEAKDISQEVLIKIYKNLDKCSDIKAFKNWACAITNNTCLDHLRAKKSRISASSLDAVLENDDMKTPVQFKSQEKTPEEQFLQNEENSKLSLAISKLSPNDKSMIILRDINGYTYQEIADIMDISMGTVKSKISRARERLKNTMVNTT